MKGWGRVSFLTALGLFVAVGCGGRTDSFDDYYYAGGDDDDDGGSGAVGGSGATGGTTGASPNGGSKPTAGKGGKGGKGGGTAGSPPLGGASPTAGAGGASNPFGGTGFGGVAGAVPMGGFGAIGGSIIFGGFGGTVVGGAGGEPPQDCQSCLINSCSSQFIECIQDFGCVSIIACAQASGCRGIECYSDKFCKGVIDQWGGPAGSSMNELLQTFACAANSGCNCN